jgi:integrase
MPKTPKGNVAIKVSNDRLQLVYRYLGKRTYLSLGLPDSKVNRTYAQSIASKIQMDMLSGSYDTTQSKYKEFQSEPKAERIKQVGLIQSCRFA